MCCLANGGITGGRSPGRTPGPVVFGPVGEDDEGTAPLVPRPPTPAADETPAVDTGAVTLGGTGGAGSPPPPEHPHNTTTATAVPPTQRSMGES